MRQRLIRAMHLILTLQARAFFPHMYMGLALLTVAAFHFVIPLELAAWLVPLFLFGEQGVVAVTLVGAHVFLDRNEGSATALAVTPLGTGEYVASLVLASSIFPTISGCVIWLGVIGFDERVALLAAPLFLLSLLSALIGVGLATRFSEFTSFLLGGAVPATFVLGLPAFTYLEVLPRWSFVWLPSDWALHVFALLTKPDLALGAWCGYTCVLILACAAAGRVVSDQYQSRIRYSLERVYE